MILYRSNFTTVSTIPTTTITSTEQISEQSQIHEKYVDLKKNRSYLEQEHSFSHHRSNNQTELIRQQIPDHGKYIIKQLVNRNKNLDKV